MIFHAEGSNVTNHAKQTFFFVCVCVLYVIKKR